AVDGTLVSVARSWSGKMAAAGTISHNPSLSSQLPSGWKKAGENVGKGGNVDALQQAFQNSPPHYQNLVDPAFNYVGIGVVYGAGGMIYVTVDFMQRGSASAPAPAPSASTWATSSDSCCVRCGPVISVGWLLRMPGGALGGARSGLPSPVS